VDDDDLLTRAGANCAGAYRYWAQAMGRPARLWDDLSVGDLGLPVTLPPNNATLLRPATDFSDVLERVSAFFAESPGGGYEVWSIWPIPDLPGEGFESYPSPCMIRDAGGEPRPVPPELEIVEALDASSVRAAEQLLDEVFGCASPEQGALIEPSIISDEFRVWVGFVDGRPVSTATAYVGDGFVGVYAVATAADARGRGYGDALTWEATMYRPDLPATLQASPMGRPVYEGMGYRTVTDFTVWGRETR